MSKIRNMDVGDWLIGVCLTLGSMAGAFIGATAGIEDGATLSEAWKALAFPEFILGAIVGGIASFVGFMRDAPPK